MNDTCKGDSDQFSREELVEKYTNNVRRKPTLDEILTTFDPDELYVHSTAGTRLNVYIKEDLRRIWRGGGYGHTPFIEALFKHVGVEVRRSVGSIDDHQLEYVDANESYCHTCDERIPNAHIKFHGEEE